MPRVTTWKLPLGLWIVGFVLKIALSLLVSDSVGNWVGGVFGFLSVVTFALYAGSKRHASEMDGEDRPTGA